MGLPFQLMYAYTGAFIVLGPLVLHAFRGPVFSGDERRAEELAWSLPPPPPLHAGPAAAVQTTDELLKRAREAVPGMALESVKLIHHGRENGIFEVRGKAPNRPPGRVTMQLREVDGDLLHLSPPKREGAAAATRRWILGLHFANFGGLLLRALFFVLGLATCATILTGNLVWLARRESERPSVGNRLFARLTTGFGVGVPLATAVLFLTSRLLPFDWPARGRAEEGLFLVVLTLSIGWALAARDQVVVWWQGLIASGAALLPVPVLAGRWSDAGLFGAGARLGVVVAVDVALLMISLFLMVGGAALRARSIRANLAAKP
jgi:hypothetical protein